MGQSGWLATFGSRLHLRPPRTVRLRLTLLYGAVVFVAGASLLAITFLLGAHQAVTVTAGLVRGQSTGPVPGPGFLPGGGAAHSATVRRGSGASVTVVSGGRGAVSGLAISQVRFAAEIGSSNAVHNLLLWGGIALVIVTLIGIALGWVMSGRMLRPIRMMTNTTQQISEENLHERLALDGPRGDELKELGDTIDGLLGRLEVAFEAQGRFVQNASHELRTPIAMMRTSLDVATAKPAGIPPEVTLLAAKLREGLDQAERLLESFLLLARAESEPAIDRSAVSFPDGVTGALELHRAAIDHLGLTVRRDLGDAVVLGSEILLARVTENLVDNAVRHNVPGGWIHVTTEADGEVARLTVENGGPLLDQSRVSQLGQPFRRLVVDRTASERGVGLGLSIVAAIAHSHGGLMELNARADGGLRVVVELQTVPRLLSTASRP